PRGSAATVPIDDPRLTPQQFRVGLQVLIVRNLAATRSILDQVQGVEREARQLRQLPGEGRFAAAGVAEDRNFPHLALLEPEWSPRRTKLLPLPPTAAGMLPQTIDGETRFTIRPPRCKREDSR